MIQAQIEVSEMQMPPLLRARDEPWWAWSYIDDDASAIHSGLCPECTNTYINRARGTGMTEQHVQETIADAWSPDPDDYPRRIVIDHDRLPPHQEALAPPPVEHDSSSSGPSTIVQDDYLAQAEDISPIEEVDNHVYNWQPLHEEYHDGAWGYYDHQVEAPTMEPGYFFGDIHEDLIAGTHDNIPIGWNYNEAMGYRFDPDAGGLLDRQGRPVYPREVIHQEEVDDYGEPIVRPY